MSGKSIPAFGLDYWSDEDPRLADLYANRGRKKLRIKINRNDVRVRVTVSMLATVRIASWSRSVSKTWTRLPGTRSAVVTSPAW